MNIWKRRKDLCISLFLLCPALLTGDTIEDSRIRGTRRSCEGAGEKPITVWDRRTGVEYEGTGGYLVLEGVRVHPIPVMRASSRRFRLCWTVEEVEAEPDAGTASPVLAGETSSPKRFSLSQNYPNPFNPSTTIRFLVPEGEATRTSLRIYDIRGKLIRNLVDENLSPGSYDIHWDGRGDRGAPVSSGVYMYTLKRGENISTRKMTVVR